MGRTKYTAEERKAIITAFVQATLEIIEEEGISSVSIRKVAGKAGYSSATLYLYFKDVDELTTLSSVGSLENYCRALAEHDASNETPVDTYYRTWEQFCLHAFACPQVFNHLFFDRHSASLEEIAKRYYALYPAQLDHISSTALSMVLAGSLRDRNLAVLRPCAAQLLYDEETTLLINDITVSHFHTFLARACESAPEEGEIAAMTEDFLRAVRFLAERR